MEAQNLIAAFDDVVNKNNQGICMRFVKDNQWFSLTWEEVKDSVVKISRALQKLGVCRGDRVSILSKTRYEWTLADLGIIAAGCIVVPIYETNTSDQALFILENSEAKIIFVENETQYKKVKSVLKDLPQLKQIICFEEFETAKMSEGIYSLDELIMMGSDNPGAVYQDSLRKLTPHDDASYVYTSGTTGNPKGVILTHGNFLTEVRCCWSIYDFKTYHESIIFLPLAHILGRVFEFLHVCTGFVQSYAESIDKLSENISSVRPHFMVSVPRIFEKIHAKTLQMVEAEPRKKKKIFYWAMHVGLKWSRLVLNDQKPSFLLEAKRKIAHRLVFSKMHHKFGGRIIFFVSGGAPLSTDIARFFFAFGFHVLEGYGLTETTAAVSVNRMEKIRIGTVGEALPGVQFKIAEDGEILVKGDQVSKGYYKDPIATDEAIDKEGWFHTGDIGEFDEEGFLKITDRKKDIIITAGGKNIAPQNIENFMKTDPYISQFVVHGDRRKFLSALVTLDRQEIENFAKKNKISFVRYEDLVSDTRIYDFIRQRIDDKNRALAKYETIKRFAILPSDFTIESGELTPTLKVKRREIEKRYSEIIDNFYHD